MNLRNVDLNLLVVLQALLTERSVTRAAQRLYITQPAASNALRRLRDVFEDPLLVRGAAGMELSPRALGLIVPLRDALEKVESIIARDRAFDPKMADFTLHIAVTEYVAFVLMPLLVRQLREKAPRVRLVVRDVDRDDPLASLRAGKIDLIAAFVSQPPSDLHVQTLFRDSWVCICGKNKRNGINKLTRSSFARANHISLPMQTGGAADYLQRLLSEMGISRQISVSMPHYLSIPRVVSNTDLIMTIPYRVAQELARQIPLDILNPPISIPSFSVSSLWHERTNSDPAHRWVRTELEAIAGQLTVNERAAPARSAKGGQRKKLRRT